MTAAAAGPYTAVDFSAVRAVCAASALVSAPGLEPAPAAPKAVLISSGVKNKTAK